MLGLCLTKCWLWYGRSLCITWHDWHASITWLLITQVLRATRQQYPHTLRAHCSQNLDCKDKSQFMGNPFFHMEVIKQKYFQYTLANIYSIPSRLVSFLVPGSQRSMMKDEQSTGIPASTTFAPQFHKSCFNISDKRMAKLQKCTCTYPYKAVV